MQQEVLQWQSITTDLLLLTEALIIIDALLLLLLLRLVNLRPNAPVTAYKPWVKVFQVQH